MSAIGSGDLAAIAAMGGGLYWIMAIYRRQLDRGEHQRLESLARSLGMFDGADRLREVADSYTLEGYRHFSNQTEELYAATLEVLYRRTGNFDRADFARQGVAFYQTDGTHCYPGYLKR